MGEACTGTHKVVDEVHLSLFIHVFGCVEGGMRLEKWADHLFKPISLHPCSEIKMEYNWLNFIWFQKVRALSYLCSLRRRQLIVLAEFYRVEALFKRNTG